MYYTTKNTYHKKGRGTDTTPSHVEPPSIQWMKETCTGKSYGDHVKLKLRRYPTFDTLDFYEFRMFLFYHCKPEEFLLFVMNFFK